MRNTDCYNPSGTVISSGGGKREGGNGNTACRPQGEPVKNKENTGPRAVGMAGLWCEVQDKTKFCPWNPPQSRSYHHMTFHLHLPPHPLLPSVHTSESW